MVRIKRIYDPPEADDGRRLLVDRLWPRGIARDRARVDDWLKDLAPSDDLRTWFGHDPARWEEFRARYREELGSHREMMERVRRDAKQGTVTLLFAAKDAERNNAVVLRELIEKRQPYH